MSSALALQPLGSRNVEEDDITQFLDCGQIRQVPADLPAPIRRSFSVPWPSPPSRITRERDATAHNDARGQGARIISRPLSRPGNILTDSGARGPILVTQGSEVSSPFRPFWPSGPPMPSVLSYPAAAITSATDMAPSTTSEPSAPDASTRRPPEAASDLVGNPVAQHSRSRPHNAPRLRACPHLPRRDDGSSARCTIHPRLREGFDPTPQKRGRHDASSIGATGGTNRPMLKRANRPALRASVVLGLRTKTRFSACAGRRRPGQ